MANDWLPECTGKSQGAAWKSAREKPEFKRQFQADTFFSFLAARHNFMRHNYDEQMLQSFGNRKPFSAQTHTIRKI